MIPEEHDLETFLVKPTTTVVELIATIDANGGGIALVVDNDRHLQSTLTDGDIRRALLAGVKLDDTVSKVIEQGKLPPHDKGPVSAVLGTTTAEILRMMSENVLRQIPITDDQSRVVDLIFLHELVEEFEVPLQAVVMAGGFGRRMLPLTEDLPKPMLPIGDRPLMERTIERLKSAGIKRVNIALHYLPAKITEHFGDGSQLGVDLRYVTEDQPLGTAGALRLMENPGEPLLVVNGDIVSGIDYGAMLTYHREGKADMTVAVRSHDVEIPYGVVRCEGAEIREHREKPSESFLVNAGIYLLEPSVLEHVPQGQRFDMTELLDQLIEDGARVLAFLVHEYWADIGRHRDYEKAQNDVEKGLL